MSWLKNFLKCDYPCEWKCCEQSSDLKVNPYNFWKNVREMKRTKYLFCSSDLFIFEKVIYSNLKYNNKSVLTIGLDPEDGFTVAGRIEIKRTESSLLMNSKQLQNFLEFLKNHESHISQTLPSIKQTDEKNNLRIYQTQGRVFELTMKGRSIDIDEDSLKYLCRMRSHIQRMISSLEEQTIGCEMLFFKLLNHFYYKKTIKEALNMTETDNSEFFDNIIRFHCECIDKSFITEIALHFENWFSTCIPFFIDAVMTYESERLLTFSSDQWPHEDSVVNIKKMAKSGLYYVGTGDFVQCAFCNIELYKWQPGDDPVEDHFKYKPRCPFLINHRKTHNTSDLGNPNEVSDLLEYLKEKTVEDSYDEIDSSQSMTSI